MFSTSLPFSGAGFHSSPAIASLKRIDSSGKTANISKKSLCEERSRDFTVQIGEINEKRFSICPVSSQVLQKSIPLAASIAILLWSNPADAGILSGFSGLESIPRPKLPNFDFLTRFNEENQKKYAEFDSRFKSSPLLKELLERSKMNKERNRQEIQDKYCIRGAEWGIGDCSTEGMTPEERDTFISALKEKSIAK